jgi:hypothetical protein
MAIPDIDFSVRITVIGRASRRWKGTTSQATADANNYYLSLDRAKAVYEWLVPILKTNIRTPGVKIEPISSGPPKGLEVGPTAVGSAAPLVKGPPDENAAANRSVQVSVEVIVTHYFREFKTRPKRISARTRSWTAKVMDLTQVSAALSGGRIDLVLRNNYSMKEMKAHAYLAGGNVSTSVVPSLTRGTGPIGDEVSFDANRTMGFDDFNGVFVQVVEMAGSFAANNPAIPGWVPVLGGGPGVKTKGMYITFLNLGSRAEKLFFYKNTSVTWGSSGAHYSLVSGRLALDGTNPGDWVEDGVIYVDIPRANQDTTMDGIVVSFPTEKSGVSDIAPDDQKRLKDFAISQAKRIDYFAESFTLTKR